MTIVYVEGMTAFSNADMLTRASRAAADTRSEREARPEPLGVSPAAAYRSLELRPALMFVVWRDGNAVLCDDPVEVGRLTKDDAFAAVQVLPVVH